MNFEEMKKIWDTQNNRTMYAIDEPALLKIVKGKINHVNREIDKTEIGLIMINFVVISVHLFKVFEYGITLNRMLIIVVASLISIYIYVRRINRKKQEGRFDRALLGDLDYAIYNVKYHIHLGKTFIWWYILPFGLIIFIKMILNFDSKPIWFWIGQGVMFLVAYFVTQWGAIKCHIPKWRSLEALRNTLMQEER